MTSSIARADETRPAATSEASSPDEPRAKNAIFLELLGNGLFYSLNYDRRLSDRFSVRGGLAYYSAASETTSGSSATKSSIFLVPLLVNALFGGRNHKFELGLGPLVAYASAEASGVGSAAGGSGVGVAGTSAIAYRYSPADGGFFFRAGLAPVFGKNGFLPWPGVSFGAAF